MLATRWDDRPPIKWEDYPEITPRGYLCCRATGPVVIDGRPDEAAWRDAAWSDDFIDIQGEKLPRPRFRTRMKMAWDDEYLYVAAELDEPHVWGTLTAHDAVIFHDNDFEVFIDPDADSHLYAELEVNALNTTWDLLLSRPYKDGGRAIDAWEIPGLRTAVAVAGTLNDPRDTDRGWTLEVAWPWKSLRELSTGKVPPADGDQWRVNFSRVEWRHKVVEGKYRKLKGPEDNWVWSPQGVIDMHRPERWGVVQFSGGKPGAALKPAEAAAERHLLHRVYYAQRDYRKARGGWAKGLAELGLTGPAFAGVSLEATATGWEAHASGKRRWHVRADGRVWAE